MIIRFCKTNYLLVPLYPLFICSILLQGKDKAIQANMIQVFTFTRFIVRNSVQCQMSGVVTRIQQIAGKKFDFHNMH